MDRIDETRRIAMFPTRNHLVFFAVPVDPLRPVRFFPSFQNSRNDTLSSQPMPICLALPSCNMTEARHCESSSSCWTATGLRRPLF